MSKRKIDIEKREKKKLLIIRKAFEYFKYFAVLMSFCGALLLFYVILEAPDFVAEGNYYASLFLCTTAILFGPAVYFVEEQIKYDGKKEEE
jgi:hypothetical protein